MLWEDVAESHRERLRLIVAQLVAMAGLVANVSVERLSKPIYRNVLRILRPAESAVRRLIVYASRNIVLELPPARERPYRKAKPKDKTKQAARTRTGSAQTPFPLFDQRQRSGHVPRKKKKKGPMPRILSLDAFLALEHPDAARPPKPPDDGTVAAQRLAQRLAAIMAALEDIPGQALRLARLEARRRRSLRARVFSPIREGRPPGSRQTRRHEVHRILDECHIMAWDVIRGDTS